MPRTLPTSFKSSATGRSIAPSVPLPTPLQTPPPGNFSLEGLGFYWLTFQRSPSQNPSCFRPKPRQHGPAGTGLTLATSAPGLGSPMRQALRHEGLDTGAKLARNFIEVERGPQRNVFACVRCAPPNPIHMRRACAGGAAACAYSSQ